MVHRSFLRAHAKHLLAGVALVGAILPRTAAATTAVFFPRGSGGRVERQHVTVAVRGSEVVTWSAVDVAGAPSDIGVIVAVKAGGRIEIAGRAWIDVVEAAAQVNVAVLATGACKPLGGVISVGGEGGASGASPTPSTESSGGCSGGGSGSGQAEGQSTGGCYSNSSRSGGGCGGCGGCDGIEPSEHGHPGCSAFFACAPRGPDEGSSSGSSGRTEPPRRGPYDVVKVRAGDGSALAWLNTNGYEPGASFEAGAAAVERDGYDLYALRDQSAEAPALVRSLRVITTSPVPKLPLRLARMGGVGPTTPLTLIVIANAPQRPIGIELLQIDESRLTATGSTSNYESLVAALFDAPADGGAGDAGTSATRWVVEASRSLNNVPTTGSTDGSPPRANASLADRFRAQCGESIAETHSVCTGASDAGSADASADASGNEPDASDPSDAATDGSIPPDAGPSDARACSDTSRRTCDDIDLAIAPGESAVATRFRAVIGGDPTVIEDLAFEVAPDRLPEGNYYVRDNGQPGLCEASITASVGAGVEGEAQTCGQARTRRWSGPNLGPIVVLLVALRAVAAIMKRARR